MLPDQIPVFPLDTPVVRPLEIIPAQGNGAEVLVVRDPLGVLPGPAILSMHPLLLMFLEMADGKTTVAEMARKVSLAAGQMVPAKVFEDMARQLDEALLLQTERFRDAFAAKRDAFLASPVRPAAIYGLPAGADRLAVIKELGEELRRHRLAPGAPPESLGLPPASVAGVLSPHIDYQRGGPAYAWAYRALREHGVPARTWIVLGTTHSPASHRFIATPKHFETPLGTVETDTELLDDLARAFGGELRRDEYLHAHEHTIELQALYLRHTFADRGGDSLFPAPKIVPVLVGGFDELLDQPGSPRDDEEVGAFCAALRRVLDERGDSVGVIGGVDLSHCGPQFGHEELNGPERVSEIEAGDRAALAALETGDPDRFFDAFREDGNARQVCSIAPIYCTMEAMRGRATPRVLTYAQDNSDDQACLVSFASVAFVKNGADALKTPRIILASG